MIERTKLYEKKLKNAISIVKIAVSKNGSLYDIAKDFLEMAKNYHKDGLYYMNKKKYSLALASFSYGYAWLDAGVRLGIFDVGNDSVNFTLFKEDS